MRAAKCKEAVKVEGVVPCLSTLFEASVCDFSGKDVRRGRQYWAGDDDYADDHDETMMTIMMIDRDNYHHSVAHRLHPQRYKMTMIIIMMTTMMTMITISNMI